MFILKGGIQEKKRKRVLLDIDAHLTLFYHHTGASVPFLFFSFARPRVRVGFWWVEWSLEYRFTIWQGGLVIPAMHQQGGGLMGPPIRSSSHPSKLRIKVASCVRYAWMGTPFTLFYLVSLFPLPSGSRWWLEWILDSSHAIHHQCATNFSIPVTYVKKKKERREGVHRRSSHFAHF